MPPNHGLVHLEEYDIKDSNIELSGIVHRTCLEWNNGRVGVRPGVFAWRIEDFKVVVWPEEKQGLFYDGNSYIVLSPREAGDSEPRRLVHDVYFWLGAHTSQDEAGTAAYRTVELDEFLDGAATQHREAQAALSDEFVRLFPRMEIRSGGARSGFRHVEGSGEEKRAGVAPTLLRVFKTGAAASTVVAVEVGPVVASLDDDDVFVLDVGDKIWVWQGRDASPVELAKAAKVVHHMTLAKPIESEVVSQRDSRSSIIVRLLGGSDDDLGTRFCAKRPLSSWPRSLSPSHPRKLFRLSDVSGSLDYALVKENEPIQRRDLRSEDVFVVDSGHDVWVWEGSRASRTEIMMWLKIAQEYVGRLAQTDPGAWRTPIAKVVEGSESAAFAGLLGG